ncbi:MAG: hypothetical protein HYX26_08120 [Acidobacteriales bacterium]|nr:hypothetical protein [Terriglobales bacterium]
MSLVLNLVFAGVTCAPGLQQKPAQTAEQSCQVSNLSEDTVTDVEKVRKFLDTLQKAVARNRRKQVAKLLHYPALAGTSDGKSFSIRTEKDFLKLYDRIFTAKFKKILMREKVECITRMGAHGLMVHEGEIWFDEFPDGELRIFTFNPVIPGYDK